MRQSEESIVCLVGPNDVSGLYWYITTCTDRLFFSLCQVNFDGSNSGSTQIKGFELRQLSTGTQPTYEIESLDLVPISGKFGRTLSPCSLKNAYHIKHLLLLVYKTHSQ